MSVLATNVVAGDSGPVWRLDHLDADGNQLALDNNYVCTIAVEGTSIARTITDKSADNFAFLISLTPTETAMLEVGETYNVGLQLRNDIYLPPLLQESTIRIFMIENVVP